MNNYPRPQMKRQNWQSLDGEWLLNGSTITVPYPPQASASGYKGDPNAEELSYKKIFDFEKNDDRCILHIGAADQIADIYLNGKYLGHHEGGYLPFEFDITQTVRQGKNELRAECRDRLDKTYPYGKQKTERGGMWYTPYSGIWKSVWLEQVPNDYIKDIKITPDLRGAQFKVTVVKDDDEKVLSFRTDIENPVLWTPDDPYLYEHEIYYGKDRVTVYFALRTVEIKPIDGINRVCLNGKPIFLHGLLDQGYYAPGICTASSEEYEKDIRQMKALGFNLLRKHIKIEDEQYYYLCDKLGMLVMQDMVNSGEYHFIKDTVLATAGFRFKDNIGLKGKRREFWLGHSLETLEKLYNHPCIIAYTIFNEGWGQFESDRIYTILKAADPSRLFDSTSGWFAQSLSDFDSEHIYFRTKKLKPGKRPLLLSEFGGYSYPVEGHLTTDGSYGYGACKSSDELTKRITDTYEKMVIPTIKSGLCGSIYTQVSDVEDEINGLVTYDRMILKADMEKMLKLSEKLKIQ